MKRRIFYSPSGKTKKCLDKNHCVVAESRKRTFTRLCLIFYGLNSRQASIWHAEEIEGVREGPHVYPIPCNDMYIKN
jgi:hypothetical protein